MSGVPPRVLGHRGYRARFPENTLLAFREALNAGADGIECDLQKTADGRYVIIHDQTTGRVAGRDLPVGATTMDDLGALDIGRGERIPTLQDMLRTLPPGAWLDLELKEETITPDDCAPIMAILDSYSTRANLMISSFNENLLPHFRSRGYRIGFLVGDETVRRGFFRFLGTLLWLRPHYVNLPIDMVRTLGALRSRWIARLLRGVGCALLFWTTNDPEEITFAARYAEFLVTDEVGRAVDAMRQRFTRN